MLLKPGDLIMAKHQAAARDEGRRGQRQRFRPAGQAAVHPILASGSIADHFQSKFPGRPIVPAERL